MARPKFYDEFAAKHPQVIRAYEALGDATRGAGPIDAVHAELIKLAYAAGAGIDSAVRSHTRRALEAGAKPEQLRHVPLLAMTTLGFPRAMAVRGLVEDELAKPKG